MKFGVFIYDGVEAIDLATYAGTVVTGGGVSLCIDATLYLLKRLYGDEVAQETARILEYQRAWSANLDQFPPLLMPTHRTPA